MTRPGLPGWLEGNKTAADGGVHPGWEEWIALTKQLPAPTRAKVPAPRIAEPDHHLQQAVDAVLAELTVDASADRRRLDEALRAGLAWLAATGDTCRVAGAVAAVREAQQALATDDPDQAIAALRAARKGLAAPVRHPRSR